MGHLPLDKIMVEHCVSPALFFRPSGRAGEYSEMFETQKEGVMIEDLRLFSSHGSNFSIGASDIDGKQTLYPAVPTFEINT